MGGQKAEVTLFIYNNFKRGNKHARLSVSFCVKKHVFTLRSPLSRGNKNSLSDEWPGLSKAADRTPSPSHVSC